MTVYTGLLDEPIAVDEIEPSCCCTEDPDDFPAGEVCGVGGMPMHWRPWDPMPRFDAFTPPYVAGVRRG